ncbi:MAG: spondin domain-containing protein [Dehalococcoidia bacterium]
MTAFPFRAFHRAPARRLLLIAVAIAAMATSLAVASNLRAQESGSLPTTFRVTITNTTAPEAWVTAGAYLVHRDPGIFWSEGERSNEALRLIAEIALPSRAVEDLGATELPQIDNRGETFTFEFRASSGDLLSTAQMLSHTNDAFVGLDSLPLFDGEDPVTTTILLPPWDGGTRENTFNEEAFPNGAPTAELIRPHPDFFGTQATIRIEPYPAMQLAAGGSFHAWLGPATTVAAAFGGAADVTVVWKWNGDAWIAWSLAQPQSLRQDFALAMGDVLFIVADQALTLPT